MKKGIIALTLAATSLFAGEHLPLPVLDNLDDVDSITSITTTTHNGSSNFNRRLIPYIKLGPNLLNVRNLGVSPHIGAGSRSESDTDAVDISVSYSSRIVKQDDKEMEEYQIFFPKVLYQRYLSPTSPSSLFYGAGGSWGSMKNETARTRFTGLYGDLSVGYEAGRDTMIRQIIQCNLAQPLVAYAQKGGALLTPSLEMSYSLGF